MYRAEEEGSEVPYRDGSISEIPTKEEFSRMKLMVLKMMKHQKSKMLLKPILMVDLTNSKGKFTVLKNLLN